VTLTSHIDTEASSIGPGPAVQLTLTAHWGVPNPAAAVGTPEEIDRALRETFSILDRRINPFLSLPLSTLGRLAIQKEIDKTGH
jgi:arsenate reductase